MAEHQPADGDEPARPTTVPGELTVDTIMASLKQKKKQDDEALNTFLSKLTHLQLNEKKIRKLANLEHCTSLRVLYAYGNQIPAIESLRRCQQLTTLYLQRNEITEITGLETLKHLQKVHLDHNRIQRLEGFEGCPMLEELSLSHQKIPEEMMFTFPTLEVLQNSLVKLNLRGNKLWHVFPLSMLTRLQQLDLRDNAIDDEEQLGSMLQGTLGLETLDIRGNKFTKQPKYRDKILLMTQSVQTLDDKKIGEQERSFLYHFEAEKIRRKSKSRENLGSSKDQGGIPPAPRAATASLPGRYMPGTKQKIAMQSSNRQIKQPPRTTPGGSGGGGLGLSVSGATFKG